MSLHFINILLYKYILKNNLSYIIMKNIKQIRKMKKFFKYIFQKKIK